MARKIVLESQHYEMIDVVLHHENPNHPGCSCSTEALTSVTYRSLCGMFWWPLFREVHTEESPNNGHFGTRSTVRYSGYVLYSGIIVGSSLF